MNKINNTIDDEYELEELYKWLDSVKLSRPKRNVARDFSDGVLLAELLKNFYPRLVEMHNYSPVSSFNAKLSNWVTLNNKVLKKIDLALCDEKISAISSCVPGAIEDLLKKVKRTVENRSEGKIAGSNQHLSFFLSSTENLGQIDNEYVFEQWQKEVNSLSRELSKLKDQISEKDEVIDVLQQKLTHLEAMMELKDQRLKDLTKQLNRYQEQQSVSIQSSLTSSNIQKYE